MNKQYLDPRGNWIVIVCSFWEESFSGEQIMQEKTFSQVGRSYTVHENSFFLFVCLFLCLSEAAQGDGSWRMEGANLSSTKRNEGAVVWFTYRYDGGGNRQFWRDSPILDSDLSYAYMSSHTKMEVSMLLIFHIIQLKRLTYCIYIYYGSHLGFWHGNPFFQIETSLHLDVAIHKNISWYFTYISSYHAHNIPGWTDGLRVFPVPLSAPWPGTIKLVTVKLLEWSSQSRELISQFVRYI